MSLQSSLNQGRLYTKPMDATAGYICTYCSGNSPTVINLDGGFHQEYIEECPQCHHSNCLYITVDEDTFEVNILTDYAGGRVSHLV